MDSTSSPSTPQFLQSITPQHRLRTMASTRTCSDTPLLEHMLLPNKEFNSWTHNAPAKPAHRGDRVRRLNRRGGVNARSHTIEKTGFRDTARGNSNWAWRDFPIADQSRDRRTYDVSRLEPCYYPNRLGKSRTNRIDTSSIDSKQVKIK